MRLPETLKKKYGDRLDRHLSPPGDGVTETVTRVSEGLSRGVYLTKRATQPIGG